MFTVDLSELPPDVRNRLDTFFRNETAAEIVQARLRQKSALADARNRPPTAIEGLGGQTMIMDRFAWSAMRRIYKPEPGEDRELAHWLKRKYPEWFHVRHRPTKTMVGPTSHLPMRTPIGRTVIGYGSTTICPERNLKFRKTYGETDQPTNPVLAAQ